MFQGGYIKTEPNNENRNKMCQIQDFLKCSLKCLGQGKNPE